jgi:copper(I)-binding protein
MNLRLVKSVFALCAVMGLLCPQAGYAHDYRAGALRIDHPWATATPPGAQVGAGYMKITNDGTVADRLISIVSPVSAKAAIHTSEKEGDVVKMRHLDKGLEIKPGETVELKPEGMHVMFEGLKGPLVAGNRVKAALVFDKAGSIDVEYAVEPLGTKAPPAPAPHTH